MSYVAAASSSEVGLAGELFESCLELFLALFKTLHQSNILSELQDSCLNKQLERLLLWGDGFSPAKGELDFILSTPDGSSLIPLILRLLQAIGKELVRKLSPTLPNTLRSATFRNVQPVVARLLEKVDEVIPEEEDGLYDSSNDSDDSEAGEMEGGFDNIISNITTYVDCLMDTTPSLQQAAETSKSYMVSDTVDRVHLPLFDVSEMAQSYCRNIIDKFPEAPRDLIQRLGEANWERHKRIRERLETVDNRSLEEVDTEDNCQQTITGEETLFHDSGLGTSVAAPNIPQNPTFLTAKYPKAASIATFTSFLTNDTNYGGRMPPMPHDALTGKPFRCNICGQVVRNVSTRIDWKRHVFSDLQPYICTFEACSIGFFTYPTRRLWWAHEFKFHRNQFERKLTCKKCGMVFKEQGIFEDHLESHHKILIYQLDFEAIMESLKEKDPQVFVDRSCPLCRDTAGNTPMKYAQHVGKHMEAIALAVLPQGSDSDSDSDQHQTVYDTDSDTSFAAMPLQTLESPLKQQEIIPEITRSPFAPDINIHSEKDDEKRKQEPGSGKIDFVLSDRVIIPTLDGFMAEIRNISCHIPLYLCNRLGHEQLRRYKKLLGFKIEHTKAIQRGSCSSGTLCSLTVKGNPTHPPHPAKFTGDEDSGNDIGLLTTSHFPPGVPMPPTDYLPSKFECPFCFRVKRFEKPSDWGKHVHEDLQPFTCTFNACLEPKSFKRKADWVRHENERHRLLEWWQCSEEDCNHKCFRRDNFVQHLVREHKMQEPERLKRSGKPPVREPTKDRTNFNDGDKVMSMVEACRQETTSKPSDEPCIFCGNICQSWKKLTVHLARHMEQISMPVLDLVRQADVRPDTIISPITAPIRRPTSPVDKLTLSYNHDDWYTEERTDSRGRMEKSTRLPLYRTKTKAHGV